KARSYIADPGQDLKRDGTPIRFVFSDAAANAAPVREKMWPRNSDPDCELLGSYGQADARGYKALVADALGAGQLTGRYARYYAKALDKSLADPVYYAHVANRLLVGQDDILEGLRVIASDRTLDDATREAANRLTRRYRRVRAQAYDYLGWYRGLKG